MSDGTLVATSPFAPAPTAPAERSTLERMTGKARPDLARVALSRYLALTPIEQANIGEFDAIAERYGLDLKARHALRVWAYEKALVTFWSDREATAIERAYLQRLQGVVDIDTEEARRLHSNLTRSRFEARAFDSLEHVLPARAQHDLRALADLFAFDATEARASLTTSSTTSHDNA